MHWPKGIEAKGEVRRRPSHVIDVAPTIMELAGVTKPEQWEGKNIPPAPGRSIVDSFAKDRPATGEDQYFWLHEGHRAIRVGDMKLVSAKDQPWELFDLSKDRSETKDLSKEKAKVVGELKTAWEEYVQNFTELVKRTAPKKKVQANSEGSEKK